MNLWCILNYQHDDGLFPYFLKYYREKGVSGFIVIKHQGEIPAGFGGDILWHLVDEPYIHGPRDAELQDEQRRAHLGPDDWYVPADMDEFFWSAQHPNLMRVCEHADPTWQYFGADFVDRIAANGRIEPINPGLDLSVQYPVRCQITERIICGGTMKVAIARATVRIESGHHHCTEGVRAPIEFECHHFKWHGGRFFDHLQDRIRAYASTNRPGHGESERFLQHYAKHGRVNLEQPDLKTRPAPHIGI